MGFPERKPYKMVYRCQQGLIPCISRTSTSWGTCLMRAMPRPLRKVTEPRTARGCCRKPRVFWFCVGPTAYVSFTFQLVVSFRWNFSKWFIPKTRNGDSLPVAGASVFWRPGLLIASKESIRVWAVSATSEVSKMASAKRGVGFQDGLPRERKVGPILGCGKGGFSLTS